MVVAGDRDEPFLAAVIDISLRRATDSEPVVHLAELGAPGSNIDWAQMLDSWQLEAIRVLKVLGLWRPAGEHDAGELEQLGRRLGSTERQSVIVGLLGTVPSD